MRPLAWPAIPMGFGVRESDDKIKPIWPGEMGDMHLVISTVRRRVFAAREGADHRIEARVCDLRAEIHREVRRLLAEYGGCPGAYLPQVDLHRLDLHGKDLRGATLCNANLSETNLEGANLSRAVLVDAALEGAILRGARLDGALIAQWQHEAIRRAGAGSFAVREGRVKESRAAASWPVRLVRRVLRICLRASRGGEP